MNAKLHLAMLSCAILLVGCEPVLVDRPIGTPVTKDLSKAFDGTWQTDDGRYIFFVKARPEGLLSVSGLEWSGDRFVVRDTSCLVTSVGEWMYLNVPTPRDSAGSRYYLFVPFLLSEEKDVLTAFSPSRDYFSGAVKSGKLAGRSESTGLGYVILENPDVRFFESQANAIVAASEPIILRRTRKGINKEAWPMEK